jgi:hypothetical protein
MKMKQFYRKTSLFTPWGKRVGSDLPPGVFGFYRQLSDFICAMVYFDLRHGMNRFTQWWRCSQKVCTS